MAEADLSKIVNLIMENPKLIAEIKNLASTEEKAENETTEPTIELKNERETVEQVIEAHTYPSQKSNKARRNDLLSALKPYVS